MFNFIHLQPASDHSSQPLHQLVILLSRSAWLMHVSTHSITITMHASSVSGLQTHMNDAYYRLWSWSRPVASLYKFQQFHCVSCSMFPLLPDVVSSSSSSPSPWWESWSMESSAVSHIYQILLLLVPWPSTGNSNICFLVRSDSFMSIYKN